MVSTAQRAPPSLVLAPGSSAQVWDGVEYKMGAMLKTAVMFYHV